MELGSDGVLRAQLLVERPYDVALPGLQTGRNHCDEVEIAPAGLEVAQSQRAMRPHGLDGQQLMELRAEPINQTVDIGHEVDDFMRAVCMDGEWASRWLGIGQFSVAG